MSGMRRTHYTTEIRVLLCDACGAPIETTPEGGQVACAYCRAQNQVRLRPRESAFAPPKIPISDDERWRLLRSQDGRPLVPPAALAYLVQNGALHPAKVDESFYLYQQTKREVATTHSPEAAERLFFLTLMLNTHLGLAQDDSRRRAILETSLETLELPRHQQVLRCLLASAAAKEGDLTSAERWIAPCDPMSQDLEADTAWRCARVFIDTSRGDWNAVLHVLGVQDDQVPIADAWDPTAAVFRANALERAGDLQGAVTALRARMSKESHSGRTTMQRIIQGHPQLQLCPQSFPLATQGHTQVAAVAASRGADGGIGSVFYYLGLALTIGGILLGLGIGAATAIPAMTSGDSLFGALEGAGIGAIVGISVMPVGIIFTIVGFVFRKKAQQAAWLRVNGIPAQGTIRGYQPTGTEINGVPVVKVTVEVDHPQQARYVATFSRLLSADLAPSLVPGTVVALRVHPQNPQEILLESA
ncbi:MAG: hypothetical protein H6719_14590 [Sandaracinaceae bacterium]|nr:hypothetical protein [Sandaracinaceae bacterium]